MLKKISALVIFVMFLQVVAYAAYDVEEMYETEIYNEYKFNELSEDSVDKLEEDFDEETYEIKASIQSVTIVEVEGWSTLEDENQAAISLVTEAFNELYSELLTHFLFQELITEYWELHAAFADLVMASSSIRIGFTSDEITVENATNYLKENTEKILALLTNINNFSEIINLDESTFQTEDEKSYLPQTGAVFNLALASAGTSFATAGAILVLKKK